MLYLDTAALVKLIGPEPESAALADRLDDHAGTPWISSALVEVELPRALRRTEPALLSEVPALVASLARYEVDETVRAIAASSPDPTLHSLDAIRLATARGVFGHHLSAFISYDGLSIPAGGRGQNRPPTRAPPGGDAGHDMSRHLSHLGQAGAPDCSNR